MVKRKRSDKQRKAMFANMLNNTGKLGQTHQSIVECLQPPKQKSKYDLSAKNRGANKIGMSTLDTLKSSNYQIISSQKIPKYAGKQAMPIILSSIIGVPVPSSVSNAAFDSFVDLYEVYQEKKNMDDALYVGMKSFVKNYAQNSVNGYLQSHLEKRTDDAVFKDVLLGTILLSSSMSTMIEF